MLFAVLLSDQSIAAPVEANDRERRPTAGNLWKNGLCSLLRNNRWFHIPATMIGCCACGTGLLIAFRGMPQQFAYAEMPQQ
jgi:hypothetical protein